MHIYIGFITAGILIVAGLIFMEKRGELVTVFEPGAVHVSVLFGGDMMFDRTIRTAVNEKGSDYIFSCLDPLLRTEDLVVANLEGPITESKSISQYSHSGDGNNYTFTFPTSTAAVLYAHNIRLVNIGNNHIMNFGAEGVKETEQSLASSSVGYFGDPLAQNAFEETVGGVAIAFINYNQFWYKSSPALTKEQIKEAKDKGEVAVVFTHWGEEYKSATKYEKALAHEFIDAGAEIVIGTHPHVVQEHEIYKGKNIYYSLGNLIFDQYFDDAVTHGLMVQVQFGNKGVEGVVEIPVTLQKNRVTCPNLDIHRPQLAVSERS